MGKKSIFDVLIGVAIALALLFTFNYIYQRWDDTHLDGQEPGYYLLRIKQESAAAYFV